MRGSGGRWGDGVVTVRSARVGGGVRGVVEGDGGGGRPGGSGCVAGAPTVRQSDPVRWGAGEARV